MKIEQIDMVTIKIELSGNDMTELSITYDEMDYQSKPTRRAILEIMHRVQKKITLDIETNKLFIEAFPADDGGCVLLINLIEENDRSYECPSVAEMPIVFGFSELDTLVKLCHRIPQRMLLLIKKSKLILYDSEYLLLLYTYRHREGKIAKLVQEYGEPLGNGMVINAFYHEHGKLLMEDNAIENLLKYIG